MNVVKFVLDMKYGFLFCDILLVLHTIKYLSASIFTILGAGKLSESW